MPRNEFLARCLCGCAISACLHGLIRNALSVQTYENVLPTIDIQ